MGQSRAKKRKFFLHNPLCCFCGGGSEATTIDHIPARSFFVNRKHPKGYEFPACVSCQNRTTGAEDTVRLIALMQASAFNDDANSHFLEHEESFLRGLAQRKPHLTDTEVEHEGNPIVRIGKETQGDV